MPTTRSQSSEESSENKEIEEDIASMSEASDAATAAANLSNRELSNAKAELLDLSKNTGLLSELGWPKFKEQLQLAAWMCNWPDDIMGDGVRPALTDMTNKQKLNRKNAYTLIIRKTLGSDVEMLLKFDSCPLGDAKSAFNIVKDYYISTTQAAKNKANRQFFNSTMANSHTNIVTWSSYVQTMAADLKETTGDPLTPGMILTCYLEGLLVDFKPVMLLLNSEDGLTFDIAKKRLIAYAQSNNIEKKQVGGRGSSEEKNNSFLLDQMPQRTPHKKNEY
jgi:hypothetical protein